MTDYRIDVQRYTCITPPVRLSYVAVLQKKAKKDSDVEAYGTMFMLPKTEASMAFVKDFKGLCGAVLIAKHGKEKAQKLFPACHIPLRDGDDPKETGNLACADQLVGHLFGNASNLFNQPHVMAPNGKVIPPDRLTDMDVYSGCWARLMLQLKWFDKSGNKGVMAILNALMKVKDDTRLDNTITETKAELEFSDFATDDVDMLGDVAGRADANDGFNFL
jgi:hypothetical protein